MKRHINPATVIATVALFVALGGSSLAAANYIDGASIKPNSIPANRLTQSAIVEIRGNRVPASAAVDGPKPVSLIAISHSDVSAEFKAGRPNTLQHAVVACFQPPNPVMGGTVLTGGGFTLEQNGADQAKFVLVESEQWVATVPSNDPHWRVSGFYRDANAKDPPLLMHVQAECLQAR